MAGHKRLVRVACVLAVLVVIPLSGCDLDKRTSRGAASKILLNTGSLVVLIPYPVAKVIGVFLVGAGTASEIECLLENGNRVRCSLDGMSDQQRQSLQPGGLITIKDSGGMTKKFELQQSRTQGSCAD